MSESKYRAFEIVQKDGSEYGFSKDHIETVIDTHRSIREYSYILHNRCLIDPDNPILGYKDAHWHVVLKFDDAYSIKQISDWFSVPENFVEFTKGKDGKYDGKIGYEEKLIYLTHSGTSTVQQRKTHYDPNEVEANFDYPDRLEKLLAKRSSKLSKKKIIETIKRQVAYDGMTLKEVRLQFPDVWVDKLVDLKKLRADYLANATQPSNRINYYICGSGRSGKGLLSRALARTMFPEMDDDEIFFEVGADNVTFEGYDGQPVLIWNDCRSFDLIKKLGGRDNVFNIFDTHPTRQKQNVKYGSTNLINVVNIVNSVQPYLEFLDGLAGEYESHGVKYEAEDKRQSYERFPVIFPIHAEDFEMLFNKSYFYGWEDFTQYKTEAIIKAKLKSIAESCHGNDALRFSLERRVLEPIAEKVIDTLPKPDEKLDDDDVIDIESYLFDELGFGAIEVPDDNMSEEEYFCDRLKKAFEHFCDILDHPPQHSPIYFSDKNSISTDVLERWKFFVERDFVPFHGHDLNKMSLTEREECDICIYRFLTDYQKEIGRTTAIDVQKVVDKIAKELMEEIAYKNRPNEKAL